VTASSVWFGTRSADGATMNADSVGEGQGELPYFVIATDATEFDSSGSLSGSVLDEFFVFDPVEQSEITTGLDATFSLSGTFQPVTDGGGNVIPLPAGVWLGLAALAAGGVRRGALTRGRHFLRLV
jgi:hypothetical protein